MASKRKPEATGAGQQIDLAAYAAQRWEGVPPETQTALRQLWSKMPQTKYRHSAGMIYGDSAKYVRWTFPTSLKTLEILHVTDVQFGNVACKYDRVIEYRDWILDQPNRFMVWGGDNVDAWALHSPGSPWDQIGNAYSQVYRFCEVWAPARHRVLGYVGGNHERRAQGAFGDLGSLIAMMLQVPYSGGQQMLDIHFGKHDPFKITLWHGMGGATTPGAIANKLARFASQGDSDLYLMGHHHKAQCLWRWRRERDPSALRLRQHKVCAAIGSSFLELWGSYGETAGYDVSDVMMAKAVLEPTGKWELVWR